MIVIILNCVTLVLNQREDVYLEHKVLLDRVELIFAYFYLTELILKFMAQGIILDKTSFLRNT